MPWCQLYDEVALEIAQSKVAKAVKRHGHKQQVMNE